MNMDSSKDSDSTLLSEQSNHANFVAGILQISQSDPPLFSDFTIVCANGETVSTHRMILAARSKFFEALFRQDGEGVMSVSVPQFSRTVISTIVKSLIKCDFKTLEKAGCWEVLEATDYFQIEYLMLASTYLLKHKLSTFNFVEFSEMADTYNAGSLLEHCAAYGQQRLQDMQYHMSLKSFHGLSKNLLLKIFKVRRGMVDEQHRPMDFVEIQLCLYDMIFTVLDETGRLADLEEFIANCFHLGYLHFSLNAPEEQPHALTSRFIMDYKRIIVNPDRREALLNSLPVQEGPSEGLKHVEYLKYIIASNTFGDASDISPDNRGEEWEILGDIRAIGVKTRLWDGRTIVQGFKVVLKDGTQKAVGMDFADDRNVTFLELDQDDHLLYPSCVRSGWYLDQIGFHSIKEKTLGPVGGMGGSQRTPDPDLTYGTYLYGISGRTAVTQNAPCIHSVRFYVVTIPNPQVRLPWRHEDSDDGFWPTYG